VTAGLVVAAAFAATIGIRTFAPREIAAPSATLERIARKNDAAAMRAAAAMEARAKAQTNVTAPAPDDS
jgi:hypothetical protein